MNDLPLFAYDSLKDTRDKFWQDLREGGTCDCPVCGRFSHFNRFKISRPMLETMCRLLTFQLMRGDAFVHYNDFLGDNTRGFYDLRRWGLIETMPKSPEKTESRTSGFWRVTELGYSFLRGEVNVAKHVYVFDDAVRGYSDDRIYVHDAWGQSFDYRDLLFGKADILA